VLKMWLRHVDNLSDDGKRFGGVLIDCHVGNEKRSVDLIDCQEGRGDIAIFQVGKGEKMSSAKSSFQQGALTDGKEAKERPHPYEDSCGIARHVNEDDEKLNTSITKEEDHRSILVIGGIKIFLQRSQGEAIISVADAPTKEQQVETIMEEEEQTLKSTQTKEEYPVEFLKQWEMKLKMLEDWLDNPELEDGCQGITKTEETC
jgi:hypothetical protein